VPHNNLYVVDRASVVIRKITPNALVTTVVGSLGVPFAKGVIPSGLGSTYGDLNGVQVINNQLYIGLMNRIAKVNGLP
jgi:hypothetical protein